MSSGRPSATTPRTSGRSWPPSTRAGARLRHGRRAVGQDDARPRAGPRDPRPRGAGHRSPPRPAIRCRPRCRRSSCSPSVPSSPCSRGCSPRARPPPWWSVVLGAVGCLRWSAPPWPTSPAGRWLWSAGRQLLISGIAAAVTYSHRTPHRRRLTHRARADDRRRSVEVPDVGPVDVVLDETHRSVQGDGRACCRRPRRACPTVRPRPANQSSPASVSARPQPRPWKSGSTPITKISPMGGVGVGMDLGPTRSGQSAVLLEQQEPVGVEPRLLLPCGQVGQVPVALLGMRAERPVVGGQPGLFVLSEPKRPGPDDRRRARTASGRGRGQRIWSRSRSMRSPWRLGPGVVAGGGPRRPQSQDAAPEPDDTADGRAHQQRRPPPAPVVGARVNHQLRRCSVGPGGRRPSGVTDQFGRSIGPCHHGRRRSPGSPGGALEDPVGRPQRQALALAQGGMSVGPGRSSTNSAICVGRGRRRSAPPPPLRVAPSATNATGSLRAMARPRTPPGAPV